MDFKDIQDKLKNLRDRIRDEGTISPKSEAELKEILQDTLLSANDEIHSIQEKLTAALSLRAQNDNSPTLTVEQKRRLSIMEKTGTGSYVVH